MHLKRFMMMQKKEGFYGGWINESSTQEDDVQKRWSGIRVINFVAFYIVLFELTCLNIYIVIIICKLMM
jgi:hypothetical protein